MFRSDRRLQSAYGIAVGVLITAIGMSLAVQGWRSHYLAFDMVNFLEGAHDLLTKGLLPQYGDVSSYASLTPPGTAWLMVPGMLVFEDPRLFEKLGSGLLHFGTVIGVFLLARAHFGVWCGSIAVLLYGLSEIGLSFAGSLWAIGHPFFYVWIAYFATQWVALKRPNCVALALVTYAAGMYMDMTIAPAFFILPIAWLLYRPPLRIWPLCVAAGLSLVIWFSYLQFETGRGFVDLNSQLQRRSIFPANHTNTWCNPGLPLREWLDASILLARNTTSVAPLYTNSSGLLRPLLVRGIAVLDGLLANFEQVTALPGTSITLLVLAIGSLILLSLAGSSPRIIERLAADPLRRAWLTPLAVSMIVFTLLATEFVIRYLSVRGAVTSTTSIRALQTMLVLAGGLLLFRRRLATTLIQPMISAKPSSRNTYIEHLGVVMISVLCPWLILTVVAEPGRSERFLWLWPLQIIVLAALVTFLFERLKAPQALTWMCQLVLIIVITGGPLLSRTNAWYRTGWSGVDAAEVTVADYIAEQIQSEGRDRAAIGYHIFLYPFMVTFNIVDPRYKVGTEFDLWLKYRHAIANTNHCAEGLSPADEYRIVQTRPKAGEQQPRHYFEVSPDSRFRLVQTFGLYQVFRRD